MSEHLNHNLLTVKETAEYLQISTRRVYDLVRRGQIPAIKVGSALRIKKYSLDQVVRRQDKRDRPTVLVADDDPDVQQLFRIFFKKIGFNGVLVSTAKEAINISGSRN